MSKHGEITGPARYNNLSSSSEFGRKLRRAAVVFTVPCGLLLAAVILYRGLPLPPCLLHSVTGIYCIGCGATRALRYLVHLRFADAVSANLLIFFWLPLFAWEMARIWLQALRGRAVLPNIRLSRPLMILLLVSALLFMLLRNLPWQPFVYLAP